MIVHVVVLTPRGLDAAECRWRLTREAALAIAADIERVDGAGSVIAVVPWIVERPDDSLKASAWAARVDDQVARHVDDIEAAARRSTGSRRRRVAA